MAQSLLGKVSVVLGLFFIAGFPIAEMYLM
jgi:hypothetical protein